MRNLNLSQIAGIDFIDIFMSNTRVRKTKKSLKTKNYFLFGHLMYLKVFATEFHQWVVQLSKISPICILPNF